MLEWVDSIPVDRNLRDLDIWGSMAHVIALGAQEVIPSNSASKILGGLLDIERKFASGELVLGTDQDDVHMDIEHKLIQAIGAEHGGRMHTTRSRNDQVALDSKLYCRERLLELRGHTLRAANAFFERSAKHLEDVSMGYTHVQHAQPVSVAFWLQSYGAALLRDADRLTDAYNCTDENVLGGGAISGTSFPIDRNLTKDLLGFQKVHENALDATSARDYFLQSVAAAAILQCTLSRLADELIMWSSFEFRTVTLDDGFAMGSSMMPQKKNPGTLELLRGRAGRAIGYSTAAMTMMKGLPSGYNRDFHEDKEILVGQFDMVNKGASIIPALVETTQFNLPRMAELGNANFSTATELANHLVSRHKVPFREAHHIVGTLVGKLVASGDNLTNEKACLEHLKSRGVNADPAELHRVLDAKSVMMSYNSRGGTGPRSVAKMGAGFEVIARSAATRLAADAARVQRAKDATHTLAAEISKLGDKASQASIRSLITKYHPLGVYKPDA